MSLMLWSQSYLSNIKLSLIVRELIGRGLMVGIANTIFFLFVISTMNSDPLKIFSQRLVELRKLRGWSQERLALESGLARSYISGVERGIRNISLINIYKLAETLEIEPSELLKKTSNEPL